MKIRKEFILKKLGENTENEVNVVFAVGAYAKNINGYIKLNETAVFLWNVLINGATESELVDALLSEYDVSREIAEKDVKNILATLRNIGAIDD
ncbi:MAG: PqqD family protein [Clostridia bacterium]|nr:PqqD family protein [Clostridia bacterium]